MIIQGNHRAYMGKDSPVVAFVRDDAGPVALNPASQTIARIYAGPGREIVSIPATGDANGKVSFTVSGLTSSQHLEPGVYQLRVEFGGRVIYTANLEMV